MALDLAGNSVLITGAGSGIGRATALRFAAAGSKVFLIGRTESKLVEVEKEILSLHPKAQTGYYTVDLADKKAIDAGVKAAVDKFGGLNVVIANAGVAALFANDFSEWEAAITTNLTSVMYLSKIVLPYLEESVKNVGHASLLVNSSVLGFLKSPIMAPYVASKHGVNGWTGSLFEAVKNKGIKVSVINPALTDTPGARALMPLEKKTSIPAESIAHTFFFAATFPDGGCPTEITVHAQYGSEGIPS